MYGNGTEPSRFETAALNLLAEWFDAEVEPVVVLVSHGHVYGRPQFLNKTRGYRHDQRYKRKRSFVHTTLRSIIDANPLNATNDGPIASLLGGI